MAEQPVVVLGGFGDGLGRGLAEVFASAGYRVAALSRSGIHPPEARGFSADLSDPNQVVASVDAVLREFGRIDVYVHNVASLHIAPFLDTAPEHFETIWRDTFLSAVYASQTVIPYMLNAGFGTLLFSGATASVKAGAHFSAFSSAKFALRALSQSLAREFQPRGIHVAHVVLDGLMFGTSSIERFNGTEATSIHPRDAARTYLAIAQQPRSAWSQEIDIRPSSERF